jgi:DNA modification methylase
MKQEHSETWAEWCLDFVKLFNQGYSFKRIMRKYDTLFSWTVIAKEIIRTAEENSIKLVPPLQKIGPWEPEAFEKESSTLWEFPKRGSWSVHSSSYRGNWAPQVPRNIILQYSSINEKILDCFLGGGTTLIECFLLGRKGIGLDVSPHALYMSKQRLLELQTAASEQGVVLNRDNAPVIMFGDARRLPFPDDSIDLACCQPPYSDAIKYTWSKKGDLSRIHGIEGFCDSMHSVAAEIFRVLHEGKRCAIMMGDIRRDKMIIPLGLKVLEQFLDVGFKSEEVIIKKQFQDRSTEFYVRKTSRGSLPYRIGHEYILILQKPAKLKEKTENGRKK